MGAIRLHALRLRGTSRDYEVRFDGNPEPYSDLAIIAGQSRTGKTSVLEFVDYCLGDGDHPSQPVFEAHVVAAMLEVSLGGLRAVLVRRLADDAGHVQVHATSLEEFERPHAIERRPISPPGSPESLSSYLMELFGLSGLEVKQAPTNPTSARRTLSFRNAMWLAYLPSTRLDSHTLLRENRPSSDMQTMLQLLEISFGVAEEAVQIAEDQIKAIADQLAELRSEVAAIYAFLGTELEAHEELDVAIKANDVRRGTLERERLELESRLRADPNFPVALRQQLRDVGLEARDLEVKLRNATTLRDRLAPLRAQYGEDLKKLNFLQESGRLLNPLPVLLCPVCMSDLDNPSIVEGGCELCGHSVPPDSDAGADSVDVAREIRVARASLSELNTYLADVDDRAGQLEAQIHEARGRERTLQRRVDEQATVAVAPYLQQRDLLVAAVAELTADRRDLVRRRQNSARLAERSARIVRLEAEKKRLERELANLKASRPSRDVVIETLSIRFKALLSTFGFPELSDADLGPNFVPQINGLPYTKETSEGALTLVSIAWQLTIFEVLVENGGPHPGFLLLDSPQKNLTQREDDSEDAFSDPAIVRRMYAHIVDWLAERRGVAQVVIVDRTPPLEVSEAVVVTYSRRADRPPYGLIDDVIPPEAQAAAGSSGY